MVLAVTAILDVVQVVTRFFAEQAETLRTGHVELLFTSWAYKRSTDHLFTLSIMMKFQDGQKVNKKGKKIFK